MTINFRKILLLACFLFFFIYAYSCSNTENKKEETNNDISHNIVFYEEGRYAGWPANNGIWIWGDEILVGFVEADYQADAKGLHTYDRTTAKNKYARSLDGGETWQIEDAYEQGQTAWAYDNNVSEEKSHEPTMLYESMPDFTNTDFVFTIQRHSNNKGPAHFYYSVNKGRDWKGAYWFPELDTPGIASRTDYIIDGEKEISAFITVAKENTREGRVALARTKDGGINWEIVSWIGEEPEGFDIMPSSVRLSPNKLLTVIRTRTANGQNLLTSHMSIDNGNSWIKLDNPVIDTGRGGSPASLVKLKDDRLALSYVHRSENGSRVNMKLSSDEGLTWGDEIVLRAMDGANRDCGYPRMVQRNDGKLVIVYYWNNVNSKESNPYRYIASTIVDPDNYK